MQSFYFRRKLKTTVSLKIFSDCKIIFLTYALTELHSKLHTLLNCDNAGTVTAQMQNI